MHIRSTSGGQPTHTPSIFSQADQKVEHCFQANDTVVHGDNSKKLIGNYDARVLDLFGNPTQMASFQLRGQLIFKFSCMAGNRPILG